MSSCIAEESSVSAGPGVVFDGPLLGAGRGLGLLLDFGIFSAIFWGRLHVKKGITFIKKRSIPRLLHSKIPTASLQYCSGMHH
jgi:hypothetical protein